MGQYSLKLLRIEFRMKNRFGKWKEFQTFKDANRFLYSYSTRIEAVSYEQIRYHVAWADGHHFSGILRLPFECDEEIMLQNIIRDILYDRLYLVFPSCSLQWLPEYFLRSRADHREYDTILSHAEGFDHDHYKRICFTAKNYMEGLYQTYPGLCRIYKKARRFSSFITSIPYRSMAYKRHLLQLARKYIRIALDMCVRGHRKAARAYTHKLSRLSQEVYAERLIKDERFTKQGLLLYGIFPGENLGSKTLSEAELLDFSCRMNAVKAVHSYHRSTSYEHDLFYLVYSEVLDHILQEEDCCCIYDQTSVEVIRRLISKNIPICRAIEFINRYDPFAVGHPNYGRDIFHKIHPHSVIKPLTAV